MQFAEAIVGSTKRLQLIKNFKKLIFTFYFSSTYCWTAVWMILYLKAKDWKSLEAYHLKALTRQLKSFHRQIVFVE